MKKLFTIGLTLLLTGFTFAQDIRTKKNKILFDKKEIAQITSKKGIYTLSDLEGKTVLVIEPVKIEITARKVMTYYLIELPDGSKKTRINNPGSQNAFFPEKKLLTDYTFGPFKLLTADGLDLSVIDQMFESDQTELEKMLEYRLESRKNATEHKKIFSDSRISFNSENPTSYGYIVNFNDYIVLGYITRSTEELQKRYTVKDKNNNVLAIWNAREDNMLRITGVDETYYIHHSNATKDTTPLMFDDLAQIMLGHLVEKGLIVVPTNK
ncbi:hypothetical protein LNQ81_06195 [Myroides sp. M-43]|uniref:hypothetical protein n=1 Tax=Myroides oncorhynchi TaxID=2893756 RepID=UPI001E57C117|nr:hypothetical protein [Myroides oncorhynchi]MCC9042281.1 hypothetical protein [Myroides oncorhynchi]